MRTDWQGVGSDHNRYESDQQHGGRWGWWAELELGAMLWVRIDRDVHSCHTQSIATHSVLHLLPHLGVNAHTRIAMMTSLLHAFMLTAQSHT